MQRRSDVAVIEGHITNARAPLPPRRAVAALTLALAGVIAVLFAMVAPAGAGARPRGQAATPPAPSGSSAPSAPTGTATSGAPVTIAGTITNGTAGGTVPGAMSVTATELNAQATTRVAQVTATVGAAHTFSASLPGDPGDQFAVQTDYKGVTYVTVAHPPTGTVLPIYETSTDNSTITVPSETLTVLKGKTANTFNIIQLMRFQNSSDRTFIGTPDPSDRSLFQTVELPIPQGASNFVQGPGLQGAVTIASDGQPVASDPIVPGATDVSYLYTVTVANSGWPLSRAVIYPTSRAEILLQPGLTLTGPGLKLGSHPLIQNQHYADYVEGALAPGTTLNADVTLSSSTSTILYIGLAILLVLVVVAALVVPRMLRSLRNPKAAGEEPEPEPGERGKLIEQVAILDEAHEGGRISDEDYETRRAGLKGKLLALEGDDLAAGAEDEEDEGQEPEEDQAEVPEEEGQEPEEDGAGGDESAPGAGSP
ncbi:MAG TPA: hypothetical protein VHA57_09120 [Actinomycetota bacterium]|nr:hypothetical protein [Actinomycetota bacterium]